MVEWKKLGEVCGLERGVRVIKKDLQQEGLIPVYQNSLVPLGFFNKSNYPPNTPFVICAGAAGEVGFCSKPFWAADDCTCILCSPSIDNKYIYYCLLVNQHTLKSQVRKASVPRLSKDVISKLIIPIPSLSEQQRIVEQLDTFTSSIENLKEQIALRRKQYEYYRDQLLDLEGKEGVEMKTLGEIAITKVGPFGSLLHKDDYIIGGIPLVNPVHMVNGRVEKDDAFSVSLEMASKLANYRLKANDIIFARRGEIGRCAIITDKEENYLCGTGSLIVRFKEQINSKYMLFMFLSPYCKNYLVKSAIGGTMLNINCDIVGKMQIPVPTLSEQQRIVSILDTFEASVANLEQQLALREKQYEYYRNKLLTFE